jgi:hypothetical protein
MKFATLALLIPPHMPAHAAGFNSFIARGLALRRSLQCRGGSSIASSSDVERTSSAAANKPPANLASQAAELARLPADGTGHGCRDAPMSWAELRDMVRAPAS